jgi:hypothetical protein
VPHEGLDERGGRFDVLYLVLHRHLSLGFGQRSYTVDEDLLVEIGNVVTTEAVD